MKLQTKRAILKWVAKLLRYETPKFNPPIVKEVANIHVVRFEAIFEASAPPEVIKRSIYEGYMSEFYKRDLIEFSSKDEPFYGPGVRRVSATLKVLKK